MRTCLVDTGPLVTYLNRRDPNHEQVAAALEAFRGRLATTPAVVTEVMYFVSDLRAGPISFAKFLVAADVFIAPTIQPVDTFAAAELMDEYRDTPMDFADATLVMLANELGVCDVFTLDRRGFSTYRTEKGKGFRLMLG